MPSDAAPAARLRAYALMEAAQTEARAEALDELTDLEAEADRQGWSEVAFLAVAGRALHDLVHAADRDLVAGVLEALVVRARTLDAPAMTGLALALRAVGAADRHDTSALLADAGRAVALVEDDTVDALDRCTVLVVSAAAYNTLSLWELTDELYRRATLLAPACVQPLQEPAVAVNRILIRIEWATALFEVGDQDAALGQLRRAVDAVRLAQLTDGLPPAWQLDVGACGDVLAFVLHAFGAPEPEPSVDGHVARLTEHRRLLQAVQDVEVLPLLEALLVLGLLRTGRRADALAGVPLLAAPGSSSSGARSFPAWVRAQVLTGDAPPPAVEAHRAYGELVAGLRWTARLGVLSAARATIAGERLAVEHAKLARDVLLDPLTGLSNRRCFDDWLARTPAEPRVTALLLIDLDHFKTVNDAFGHATGDETLRGVARLVDEHVRPGDLALRLGGDEFAVLLVDDRAEPDRLRRTAVGRAQALRDAVAARDWGRVAPGLEVAVSIGVAVAMLGPHDPGAADALYRRADAELYAEKGRRPTAASMPSSRAAG